MKRLLKKLPFYREGRYVWRSLVSYKKPLSYLWHRFVIGPRIRHLVRPLDRGSETKDFSVHILCGHRDLTMLLWGIASWYRVVEKSGQLYIHEDGSFTRSDMLTISRLLPHAMLVSATQTREILSRKLEQQPKTRQLRLEDKLVLMMKLVDPFFVGDAPYRLILDSDILWFSHPAELLEKIEQSGLIMTKGYAPMNFYFKDGSQLDPSVFRANSGVVGYATESFRLGKIEEFLSLTDGKANPHFIEQAAYAYTLVPKVQFLRDERYHIKGPVSASTVMKHYTGPRREMFWFEGVRLLKDRLL